jgi:hypothetical protein
VERGICLAGVFSRRDDISGEGLSRLSISVCGDMN